MAANASPDALRERIAGERAELATAASELRAQLGRTADLPGRAEEHLLLTAGGALVAGFLIAGGLGAAIRLMAIRERRRRQRRRLPWLARRVL